MGKEFLSKNHVISIIIMFLFGSSVIFGVSTEVKQDSWISLILAIIFSLILVYIYTRIIKLFPGEGLYDIVDKLFGKVTSKIIIILMTWYAIHLSALVFRNFTEFIKLTSLLNTPVVVITILMMLLSVYLVKSNISTFGKWGIVSLVIVMIMVFITIIFSIGSIDISNLFPIMEHDIGQITKGALKIVTFPFAETVLILTFAGYFNKNENPYKMFSISILLGGFVLLIVILRNLTVLGVPMVSNSYFPSYTAARIIELDDFLARIEGVITINFILAGVVKIVVCLIAASKGVAKLFNIKQYKDLAMPVGLLTASLSIILYDNIFEMIEFTSKYWLFIIPYQLIIPIFVWLVAEQKAKKTKISA